MTTEPLPHGAAPGVVGGTGAQTLHRHRAADAAPGEAGQTEGDRRGTGGEVLQLTEQS